MNLIQENLQRFREAEAAHPSAVIYIAWESMNEIRFVATDKGAFAAWLNRAPRYPYITVTEMVLNQPDTACYYQIERWLTPELLKAEGLWT
jgi:hypothetical protein